MTAPERTGDVPSGKKLLRASSIMAAGSLISRILGLVRNVLVGAVLGVNTRQGDILALGTTIPTSIFFLVAGGALNTVLVPQIVRAIKNDADGGEAYINRIITLVGVVIAAATAICLLGAPLLLYIYADGKWRAPELAAQYQSLTMLAYLTMPQIFIFGVFFMTGQVLNAKDKFGPMMWAPIANNVVAIANIVLYLVVWGTHGDKSAPFTTQQVLVLGIGSTLGCLAQAAVMLPYMRSAGIRYRPRFDFRGTGLGHTADIAKWVLLSVLVGQVVQIATTRLVSPATTGGSGAGVTTLQNAILIWMLPHGMITVSLTTAMVPAISRLAASHDLKGVRRETQRTLKLANTLIVPIAIGLAAVSYSVAMIIFGWGHGRAGVPALGWTLWVYCFALPLYSIFYVQIRTFYALEDTRSTFTINNVVSITWLCLSLLFIYGGMALFPGQLANWFAPLLASGFVIAHIIGVVMGFRRLERHLPLNLPELVRHFVRLVVAAIPAAIVAHLVVALITRLGHGPLVHLLALVPAGALGVGIFLWMAQRLHIAETHDMVRVLLRRGRRADAAPEGAGSSSLGSMADTSNEGGRVSLPEPAEDPIAATTGVVSEPEVEPLGDTAADTKDEHGPVAKVRVGDVLGGRYRLERQLARRSSVLTWEAFDEVLSRPVLIHLLAPHDARADEMLAAARRAAVATDSRFLRVLDAVISGHDQLGSWIVCEFASGVSVEGLLQAGPLTAVEAGWIARELADALAPMHAQGLYHERLNPDTVIISSTGNVKIVGFLTEAVLHPEDGDGQVDEAARAAHDVEGIGRLLYAMMVGRWPDGDRYGLPDAPRDGAGVLSPRQVRAGILPAMDQICDRILCSPPRCGLPPLRTATDVVRELSAVLGPTDGAHELERRLRLPITIAATSGYVPPTSGPYPSAPSAYTPSSATEHTVTAASARPAPVVTERVQPPVTVAEHANLYRDEAPTQLVPAVEDAAREAEPALGANDRPVPFTPVPAPENPRRIGSTAVGPTDEDDELDETPDPNAARRSWAWFAVSLFAIAVAAGVALMTGFGRPVAHTTVGGTPSTAATTSTPTPSATTPPAAPTPVAIVAARDFDPLGSGREVPARVPNATDGKADTYWTTERYPSATFSGKKPGVGLWVDLGKAVDVRAVKVAWRDVPVRYQLMVPAQGATAPTTIDGWRSVATVTASTARQSTTLAQPVSTRYVLVWITEVPRVARGYQAAIGEIEVDR